MLSNIFYKNFVISFVFASLTSVLAMESKGEQEESVHPCSVSSSSPSTAFQWEEKMPETPLIFEVFYQEMTTTSPLRFIDSPFFVRSRYTLIPLRISAVNESHDSALIMFAHVGNNHNENKQFWAASIKADIVYSQEEKNAELSLQNMAKEFIKKTYSTIDAKSAIILSKDEKLIALIKKVFCDELSIKEIKSMTTPCSQLLFDKKTGVIHKTSMKIIPDILLLQLPINKPSFFQLGKVL